MDTLLRWILPGLIIKHSYAYVSPYSRNPPKIERSKPPEEPPAELVLSSSCCVPNFNDGKPGCEKFPWLFQWKNDDIILYFSYYQSICSAEHNKCELLRLNLGKVLLFKKLRLWGNTCFKILVYNGLKYCYIFLNKVSSVSSAGSV